MNRALPVAALFIAPALAGCTTPPADMATVAAPPSSPSTIPVAVARPSIDLPFRETREA